MAEAIGTAASVLGLAGASITVIERIVNAVNNVRSAPETIATVTSMLGSVHNTLQSIKQKPSLDNNDLIAGQIRNIEVILLDMEHFLDGLQERQKKSKTHNVFVALKDPLGDNNKFDGLIGRLDTENIHLLIQMGISHADVAEGVTMELVTARKALLEVKTTGEETKILLKDGIALLSETMNQSRVVPYAPRNDRGLPGLDQGHTSLLKVESTTRNNEERSNPEEEKGRVDENLEWRRNTAGDKAKLIAGNLCVGKVVNADTTVVRSTVTDSEFGNGLRFINGNVSVSGDQADFVRDFWKD